MEKLIIICVDDQREVLASLRKDLEIFIPYCSVFDCESADETTEVLEEIESEGNEPALIICDHVMPGKSGIEFLIELSNDPRFAKIRKLLLTGLATQQDTIQAINDAQIDYYLEKPWEKENLIQIVKKLLSRFVISAGIEFKPYLKILDQEVLYEKLRQS